MNEEALRALVRESVARHLGAGGERQHELLGKIGDSQIATPLTFIGHASHYRYLLPESDGPCLIEPTVQCNRCGYCESHGH